MFSKDSAPNLRTVEDVIGGSKPLAEQGLAQIPCNLPNDKSCVLWANNISTENRLVWDSVPETP